MNRNKIAYTLAATGFILVAYLLYFWVRHPDFTTMEVLFENWYFLFAGIVCIMTSMIIEE
jgi:uncharacterized integral membrane protein